MDRLRRTALVALVVLASSAVAQPPDEPDPGDTAPRTTPVAIFDGHTAEVTAVAFIIDGQRVVSVSTKEVLSGSPYAGWRLGLFLGGLVGGQVGGGTGLVGITVMTAVVVGSAVGAVVPMLACRVWRPVRMDHWLLAVVTVLGGIAGAVAGSAVGVVVFDPRRKRNENTADPELRT